eukprot:TCALIF_03202-PA protein Name:"Similar to unc-89 Muscle M-line assembly protein unc-89 (Caenorhabditis elegans)" AED:0.27 eAED:0.27 QI:0/0.83/0.76/0.92/0.91/0.88/25/216/2842
MRNTATTQTATSGAHSIDEEFFGLKSQGGSTTSTQPHLCESREGSLLLARTLCSTYVEIDMAKLVFTKQVQGQLCDPGEKALLSCATDANIPGLTATWLKDNKPLDDKIADRVKVMAKENHFTLEVNGSDPEDSGQYTCRVSSPNGDTITCSGHLEVHKLTPAEKKEREESNHPVFLVKLRDSEILHGSTASFMIHVKGNPNPDVKFYKDGVEIKEDSRISVNRDHAPHGSYELTVHQVKEDDSGSYSVAALNTCGTAECVAAVTTKDAKDVFALLQGHEKKVAAGEEPTFTWFKSGQEFDPEDRFKVLFKDEEDTLALVFQHINPEDAGLYTCVASTSTGKISCSAELSVEGGVQQLLKEPEPPKIISSLGDVDSAVGSSAMLEFKMKGYPRPNIKWSKDGKPIQAGGRFKFVNPDPETCALIITKVEADDEGKYEVVLENDLGQAKTEGKLVLAGAPQFKEKIGDQTTAIDDPWKIVAKVTGNPQLTWYKDGVPIKEDGRIKCVKIDDETFELQFTSTQTEDNGNWAVIARNPQGEMSQFFQFSAQMLPRFEVKLSDVETNENKEVVLKCKIACIPPPEVTWFKGGTDITKDPRFKASRDKSGFDCLQIPSISRGMAGEFEVKATNDMGTAACKCNVKVNTKPVCDDMEDSDAFENDEFAFKIECDGDPKPVCKWTKDGKAIDLADGHVTISESNGIYSLNLKPVKMDDKGKYEAEFTNRAGEKKVGANLNVLAEDELKKPKCMEDLKDKKANKGDKAFFHVKIRGEPTPTVKWFLNDKELTEGGRFHMSEKDFVYRLDIKDISEDLVGKVKVVAMNENGEDLREAALDVLYEPEFETMGEFKAGPGDVAKVVCRVKASPDPDIFWSRKGEDGKVEKIEIKPGSKWERCHLSMEKDGPWEVHTLTIKDTVLEDAGEYQVNASNRVGKKEVIGSLKVVTEPPNFPVPLHDVNTKLGSTEVFQVVVGGVPKPQVQWMKGDKELKKNKRMLLEEEEVDGGKIKYKLTITDIDMKDFGDIVLKATNMAGEAESVSVFQINPVKPTIEADFPKIAEMKEGGDFVLTAKVDGSPPPTAIWLCEGEPVKADGKRIIITEEEADDGNGIVTTLRIVGCKDEDSGKYTLLVKNSAGEAHMDSVLDVAGKPKAPKVIKEIEPKEVTIPGKTQLKLSCKISGQPTPAIKWFRDGNEIKVRKGVLISQDAGGGATLIIEKAQVSDAGKYTAQGINEVGQAETSCTVHVTQPNEEPKFTSLLRSAKAVEGSPVKLEGKVTGHPMPTIKWLKNEQEFIPDGKRVKAFMNPDGTFGLIFETTVGDDKGAYTAVAVNAEGAEARSTANVAIRTRMKEGVEKALPSFARPLGDIAVDEGQKLRITTPIRGNPVPTFSWTKDGKPLDSDRVHFFSDGELIGMEISDAVLADAGKYECHLVNEVGKTTGECNVTVHKIFKPPVFTKHLTEVKQIPGCDARFICEVGANPKPEIQWLFNGKPVEDGGRYKIKTNGNIRSLNIKKITEADMGEYKCVAKNKEGEAESKANLEVVEYVERKRSNAPEFLKTFGDELVFRGMSARFTALVSGDPEPEFEVLFNGEPLLDSDRIHISRDRSGLIRVNLVYVEETDIGKYGLRVWNEHGEAFCESKLMYDGLEVQPDQSLGDCYMGFDKYSISGLPIALPDKPLVTQMSDTKVTLTWKPALALGPNLAPYYMVEMAEYPEGDWVEVYEEVRGISCDINGLTPLRDYRFRVSVRNRFGLSDPSPYCVAHRTLLADDMIPKDLFLEEGAKFDLSQSCRFPKGFDIYKEPYEGFTHAPRFLQQEDKTQYGVKNASPEIMWNLYGFPMPDVSFKFEGQDIEIGDKFSFNYSRNGVVSLQVRAFSAADVGVYECVARNDSGEASQSVQMLLAQPPEFIRAPTEVNLVGVNGGKIECQIFGVPTPKVVWYKDYHPHKETFRVQAYHYPPDVYTMYFEDYITKDEGLYTVVASNMCGSINHSVIVRIMEDEREYEWMTYRRTKQIIPKTRGFDKYYHMCEEIGRGTQGITSFVQQIMPIEADQSGHHVVEEADSKYWWLHRGNDRETLQRIQMGDIDFDFELWQNISREAKHFVANMLVYKPEERMSVRQALAHPWLQILKQPGIEISEQYQISTERLRNYYNGLKEWYANASCDFFYRRRPLAGAFTHPSCMVYPPGEPEPMPERTPEPPKLEEREWRRPSYTIEPFENPSNYQIGPDSYLLQVKDPGFPARLREYLGVARTTSREFRDVTCPIVKERRRFIDVMEEEIEIRREDRLEAWGRDDFSIYKPHKVLQVQEGEEVTMEYTKEREVIDGTTPFFREKPSDLALAEGEPLEITCMVAGDPKPSIQWLKNDLVFMDDSRLSLSSDDVGRSRLILDPAMPSDAGLYKIVARNVLGQSVCNVRVVLGDIPESPDSPIVEAMTDTDMLLSWKTPSRLNHSPIICYKVQMGYIDTDIDWVDLADDIKHEYFVIDNLRPSNGYKFRVAAMNKFGWSIPSIPSGIAMTPSKDINLDCEDNILSYENEKKASKMSNETPKEVDFMSELMLGQFSLTCNISHKGKISTAKIYDKSDPDGADAAKREFKNLKSLRHQRMVTLVEAFENDKMCLLKMDTLPGTDVLSYLAERATYSEQMVADIASQAIDALGYIHWRGKVYLNLEPGNIIVCSGRSLGKTVQVKLANFETAQTVAETGTQIKGSYNFDYAAPEILKEAQAFPQSDVWSLGVLLYVLLSGQLPFKGETAEETRDNILNVRFKFEWLYKETTMEATRLLMWIFKSTPWKRPSLEEIQTHRWLNPFDYMAKKRARAYFPSIRIQKFAREYHRSRPRMEMDAASFFSKMLD